MRSRYVGRASGRHRDKRQRRFRIFVITGIAAGVSGLALIGVLIMNPGGDRPANEKGSQPSSGVTPTTTPPPTHSHASKLSGSPSVTPKPHKSETPTPRKTKPAPKPSTTPPTPTPPGKMYVFFVRDTDEQICERHKDVDTWKGPATAMKYFSFKDTHDPKDAFKSEQVEIPGTNVECPIPPPSSDTPDPPAMVR